MNLADPVPEISFIVLTANRVDDLVPCLESILRQQGPTLEIIVVDNASRDQTQAVLAERFPQVRLHPSPVNLGVSEGRNVGIQMARAEICVCVDDDAYLPDSDTAERILRYFATDPALACVAMTILGSKDGREEYKGIPRLDKKSFDTDYPCTYFCGAGFAVRRSMFLEAGGFWAPLVYGSQELDLAYRYLDRHWHLLHSATARVIHKSSPLERPHGQWVYFNTRDRVWVALRHLPWRAVLTTTILWWGQTLAVAARQGHWGPLARGWLDSIQGIPRAIRGRKVLSPQAQAQLRQYSGRFWY